MRRYRILRSTDDPNHVSMELRSTTSKPRSRSAGRCTSCGRAQAKLGLEGPRARIAEAVETTEYRLAPAAGHHDQGDHDG